MIYSVQSYIKLSASYNYKLKVTIIDVSENLYSKPSIYRASINRVFDLSDLYFSSKLILVCVNLWKWGFDLPCSSIFLSLDNSGKSKALVDKSKFLIYRDLEILLKGEGTRTKVLHGLKCNKGWLLNAKWARCYTPVRVALQSVFGCWARKISYYFGTD